MTHCYASILSVVRRGFTDECRRILPIRQSERKKTYMGTPLFFLAFAAVQVHAAGGGHEVNLMDPSPDMALWTCITFAILLVILWKFAWNPILSGLDKRESDIRESVENAVRIREEMETLEANKEQVLKEADDKAKEIVAIARKAAVEASKVIEDKAKQETKIMLENASREIEAEQEKARAQLRLESAELSIAIASKLIGENLDNEKNRMLSDRLIREI